MAIDLLLLHYNGKLCSINMESNFFIILGNQLFNPKILNKNNLENYKNSGKIYVTKIEKIIETFLSIFDLITLTFTNKNDNNIEHDHSLINEEINLNERF